MLQHDRSRIAFCRVARHVLSVRAVASAPTRDDPFSLRHVLAHRCIGRAYYLAREIAADLPSARRVLDVGCGKGFVAYHLGATLGCEVEGVDLMPVTVAPIPYRLFDGDTLPHGSEQLDGVLFCYVLHHARDPAALVREAWRVLRPGGRVVVYEDLPITAFDRMLCALHEAKWRGGRCTFLDADGWRRAFVDGFEIVDERAITRFRDLTHPVRRHRFVLRRR